MSVALPSQAKLGSVATSTWRARLLVTAEGPRQNRFTLRETDGVPWKLYALCVSFPASLFVKNAFLCKKHASWLSKQPWLLPCSLGAGALTSQSSSSSHPAAFLIVATSLPPLIVCRRGRRRFSQ
ncbi:hypothetical protein M514_15486 [Trichuris suis]|uniref:Uncharacterized protein n=1 Tax=Trichuris suis TaxID=68888 RepID=A0A085NRW7_9BILA|nr:hypothetical protein M514_15486 [Trichuris suis]